MYDNLLRDLNAHTATHSFLVSCGPTTCIWITYGMMGKWLSNKNTPTSPRISQMKSVRACLHESPVKRRPALIIVHFHIVRVNMIPRLSVNVESTGMSLPSPPRSRFSLCLFSLRFLLFLFEDGFRFEAKVNRLEDGSRTHPYKHSR